MIRSVPRVLLSSVCGIGVTLGAAVPSTAGVIPWMYDMVFGYGWGAPMSYGVSYGSPVMYGAPATYGGSPCGPAGCGPTSAFYGPGCCDPCNVCCSPCGTVACSTGNCPGGDCGVNYSPGTGPTPDPSPAINRDEPTDSIPADSLPPGDEFVPSRRDTDPGFTPPRNDTGTPGDSIPSDGGSIPRDGGSIPRGNTGNPNNSQPGIGPTGTDDEPLFPPRSSPADSVLPGDDAEPLPLGDGIRETNTEPLDLSGRVTWRFTPQRHRVRMEARYRIPQVARIPTDPQPVMADSEHLVRR